MTDKRLAGKVALVTGAGRGIGRAIAEKLAREGARVVVNDLDDEPAAETIAAIERAGGEATAFVGSVTDAGFAERFVKTALDSYGGLDIIVNNAGFTWDAVIQKMSDEQFQAIMDVHVTAPFRILRAAAEPIREFAKREAADGREVFRKLVNISSVSGLGGNPGQVNYASAKMAVVGMTKTLAKEWGRLNVCVNAVAYGFIETRLTAAKTKQEKDTVDGHSVTLGIPENLREAAIRGIPLGRPGTPENAAGPVLFLCSPLSDYVTGVVLLVTGGSYM